MSLFFVQRAARTVFALRTGPSRYPAGMGRPTVLTLAQVRRLALALPETEEAPHFDRTSFRVRGKIFVTAKPDEPFIHVFVGEDAREPALATNPDCMTKLFWGGKVVGLRIALAGAPAKAVEDLIRAAWRAKAPQKPTRSV